MYCPAYVENDLPVDVALQTLPKPNYHPRLMSGYSYPSRKRRQTRSLQIPVDQAHKCENAASHRYHRGVGPEPFGMLIPQQWGKRACGGDANCRTSCPRSSSNLPCALAESPRSNGRKSTRRSCCSVDGACGGPFIIPHRIISSGHSDC